MIEEKKILSTQHWMIEEFTPLTFYIHSFIYWSSLMIYKNHHMCYSFIHLYILFAFHSCLLLVCLFIPVLSKKKLFVCLFIRFLLLLLLSLLSLPFQFTISLSPKNICKYKFIDFRSVKSNRETERKILAKQPLRENLFVVFICCCCLGGMMISDYKKKKQNLQNFKFQIITYYQWNR